MLSMDTCTSMRAHTHMRARSDVISITESLIGIINEGRANYGDNVTRLYKKCMKDRRLQTQGKISQARQQITASQKA